MAGDALGLWDGKQFHFGHADGEHLRGAWAGSWINELGVQSRGWLEIQNVELSAHNSTWNWTGSSRKQM